MRNMNFKDIAFFKGESIKGDINIAINKENKVDFLLTSPYQTSEQDLKSRLLTQVGDWRSHPNIAANLERFVGMPNTRDTAEEMSISIKSALMGDGRFTPVDTQVHIVPVTQDRLEIITITESNDHEDIIINEIIDL